MIRMMRTRTLRAMYDSLAESEADAAAYVMECADWQKQFVKADRAAADTALRLGRALDSADANAELLTDLGTEVGMLRESLLGALHGEKLARARVDELETEAASLRRQLQEAQAAREGIRHFYVTCKGGAPLSIHETREDARAAAEHMLAPSGNWRSEPWAAPLSCTGWAIVPVALPPVAAEKPVAAEGASHE